MPRTTARPFRLLLAAATVLVVTACGGTDDANDKGASATESSASQTVELTPASVTAAYEDFTRDFAEEVFDSVASEPGEEELADMAAYLDDHFPRTQAWFDVDSFVSETHYHATMRYLVGLTTLIVAFEEDLTVDDLVGELALQSDDITIDGDTATITFEDSEPFVLRASGERLLVDGSVYDDDWFAEQGTTPEEALAS